MKKVLFFVLFSFCSLLGFSQADTLKVANGAWNVAGSWTAGIPTNAQDVVIPAGRTATVPGSGPVCKSLTINGTLKLGGTAGSGPYQVTVSNNVSVASTGTISMTGGANCYIFYSGSSFTVASGAVLTMVTTGGADAGINYSGTVTSTLTNNSASDFGSIAVSSSGTLVTGSDLNLNNQISVNTTGTFNIALDDTVTMLGGSGIIVYNGGKINVNGTLINQASADMDLRTVAYSIYLNTGATYVHQTNGAMGAMGTGTSNPGQPIFDRFKIDPASTFIYRGNTGTVPQSMDGKTYGNLTFESTSGLYHPDPSGNGLTVLGNFNIGGSGAGIVLMNLNTSNPYTGTINVSGNTIIGAGSEIRTYATTGNKINTAGDMDISGTLTLNSNVSLKGNWNMDVSGSVALGSASADSVVFNGTGTQTITKINGGGIATFPYFVQNKASGSIVLNNNPATDVTISTTAINVLALNNAGQIDLNGRTFTLSGAGGSISASGAARNIISSVAGGTLAIAGTKTVANANGGSLVFGNNVTVLLTASFNPGLNLTMIGSGAALQINPGGSCATNMPLYATGSSLIYNKGGLLYRSLEWGASGVGTIGTTPGYPHNVIVQNNALHIGIGPLDNHAMNGDLTIASGSSLYMDTMDIRNKNLTVNGNVILNGTLNLASGTNADSTQGQIFVGGNWTRSSTGVFNPNVTSNPPAMTDKARAVTFIGTATSTISAPYSATRNINGSYGGETFPYLYINKTNAANIVSLAANITIAREIGFQKGTFTLNDSNVCIISNTYNTAHVAAANATQISNTTINYNGKGRFIIQRYLPIQNTSVGRRWRALTAPIQSSGAPTINAAWQEGVSNTTVNSLQNPSPGFGTEITDNTIAFTGNGYDAGSQANSSLYYLDPVTGYNFPSATNSGAITDHDAYMLFVRGDRSIAIANQFINANSTTLEPKGKINIGNVTKVISSSAGTIMVGNPYASAIKMDSVKVNGTPFVTAGTYYVWDPKTDGSSQVGKFISVMSNGDGTYVVGPNVSNVKGGVIESSDAFMVLNTPANTSISFTESNKITSSRTTGIASRPENNITSNLTTSVYALLSGSPSLAGGTVNLFSDTYSDAIDTRDAPQLAYFNSKEVFSISRNNKLLSIETRAGIQHADTVFFNMLNFNAATKTYRLQFAANNFGSTVLAVLKDKYLNTSTQVNLTDTTNYDFNITADTSSQVADRFMIVFTDASPLAVNFKNVQAQQQSVNAVQIEWNFSNTSDIQSFRIERSADGVSFNTLATVKNNIFSVTDNNAASGNNYYRIASLSLNGNIQYSQIVKINIGNANSGVTVYPNPVKDVVSLQLNNMPAGKYDLILSNAAGQQIMKSQLSNPGGVLTEMIALPATMTGGVYDLQLKDAANNKKTIRIIKD